MTPHTIKLEAFMSLVVGLVDGTEGYLACESRVTEGDLKRKWETGKIFVTHAYDEWRKLCIPLGIGIIGVPYLLYEIMYNFELPTYKGTGQFTDRDLDKYVLGTVIPKMCKEYLSMERDFGGMIVANGMLYTIDHEFNSARVADVFDAIGSGAQLALGALGAMEAISHRLTIADLEMSIDVTARFSSSCDDNFMYLQVLEPYHLVEEGAVGYMLGVGNGNQP